MTQKLEYFSVTEKLLQRVGGISWKSTPDEPNG
jgi:hypothetical protein